MNKQIGIRKVFLIKEKGWLLATLDSFEWDFTQHGSVWLCFLNKQVPMRYIGSGTDGGYPFVTLVVTDATKMTLEEINAELNISKLAGEVYLERETE